MMMISHISDHCFLFLQLEQPIAVVEPYFLRMFSPFSTFSTSFIFSDDKFLGFVLLDGISGCLWFLDTLLLLKDADCTSQGCSWLPVQQAFPLSAHMFCYVSLLATRLHLRAAHIKIPLQIFCIFEYQASKEEMKSKELE